MAVGVGPEDVLAEGHGLLEQVWVAGDRHANAGGGELVGEGGGVAGVGHRGGEVGEHVTGRHRPAQSAGQGVQQPGGEVRGAIRLQQRQSPTPAAVEVI